MPVPPPNPRLQGTVLPRGALLLILIWAHHQGGQDSTEEGQVQATATIGVSTVGDEEVSESPACALGSVLPCVLSNDDILICSFVKGTYWLI